MKQFLNLCLALSILLYACNGAGDNTPDNSIEGTYVLEIDSEYAKGIDTLIVTVLDKEAGTFTIDKKYGFMRYRDGQEAGRDHKTDKFTAAYNKEHKQLHDSQKGQTFTYVPDKKVLLWGNTEYKKID